MIKNMLRLMKYKKGMSSTFVVSMIIVLIVAMIIFTLLNGWPSLGFNLVGEGNQHISEGLLG